MTSPPTPTGQALWVTGQTLGDALARMFSQVVYTQDAGLYGGSFRITGGVYPPTPVVLHLSSLRFVSDLAVSGRVTWTKASSTVTATVTVAGPAGLTGSLHYTWPTDIAAATASVTGAVDGVALTLLAASPATGA